MTYDPARLATYSTTELIDLLSVPSLKQNVHPQGLWNTFPPDRRLDPDPPNPNPRFYYHAKLDRHALDFTIAIEQELKNRHPVDQLIDVFRRTRDPAQRAWMIDVLTQIRGPRADAALRPFATLGNDEVNYFALKYFALACDGPALALLAGNNAKFSEPLLEKASIFRSFGECKYRPAVPLLIDALPAIILDAGYAAQRSLLAIYPDAGIDFSDPIESQKRWRRYVSDHG